MTTNSISLIEHICKSTPRKPEQQLSSRLHQAFRKVIEKTSLHLRKFSEIVKNDPILKIIEEFKKNSDFSYSSPENTEFLFHEKYHHDYDIEETFHKVMRRENVKQTVAIKSHVDEVKSKLLSVIEQQKAAKKEKPLFLFFDAMELFYDDIGGSFWILLHNEKKKTFYPAYILQAHLDSTSDKTGMAIMENSSGGDLSFIKNFSKRCERFFLTESIKRAFFCSCEDSNFYLENSYQHLGNLIHKRIYIDEIIHILRPAVETAKTHTFPIKAYETKGKKPSHKLK